MIAPGLESSAELQRAGRAFVQALYAALRALKLYPLDNQTARAAIKDLDEATARLLLLEGRITLQYVGDFCFLNDLRLRIDLTSYATFGGVGRALRRHGIGQITVEPEVTASEWVAFLSLLLEEPRGADPYTDVLRRMEVSQIRHLGVAPWAEEGAPRPVDAAKEAAKATYFQSVVAAREALQGARMGQGIALRRVRRAVQSIVDQVLTNEASILGMTALRDYDEYTFTHSVNVCIFSVALGKKIGLSKSQLFELGLCALLHDIGKTRMPTEITTKAALLTDEEWATMREHTTEGLLLLLTLPNFSEMPLRAPLVAYEHHMHVGLTGYPTNRRPRRMGLLSRIVAVADGFDAATSRRSYQAVPWTPDRVLQEMRDNPRRGYDPLLVKAFISLTGIYPVGTLVVLDTFELAVVVRGPSDPARPHLPIVKVIFDDMGLPIDPPVELDLSIESPSTDGPPRRILKAADPERYGIDIGAYFL